VTGGGDKGDQGDADEFGRDRKNTLRDAPNDVPNATNATKDATEKKKEDVMDYMEGTTRQQRGFQVRILVTLLKHHYNTSVTLMVEYVITNNNIVVYGIHDENTTWLPGKSPCNTLVTPL
jgi:hypothetical protein